MSKNHTNLTIKMKNWKQKNTLRQQIETKIELKKR